MTSCRTYGFHAWQCSHQKSYARKLLSFVAVWVVTPSCWNKQSHLFSSSNELWHKIWIIFHSNCLFKEHWSHVLFSRHCAPNTSLWRMQKISIYCTWVLGTPYSSVLTINVATQWKHALSIKNQLSNPFVWRKKETFCWLQNYHTADNQLRQRNERVQNDSVNVWSVCCTLVSVFIHVWGLAMHCWS